MSKEKKSHRHSSPGPSHGHAGELSPVMYLNRAFMIGIALNLVFVFVEFGAGLFLNSVALMSDAGHNLSDVISLALALMAFKLAARKPSDRYTYGHKKSTVLVSLVNACLLLVAIGVILVESIDKLSNPIPVQGGAIAWVAGVGIVINAFTAWLFIRHKNKDLNVKGAYLHMVADTLVSVGVLISGVIISYTGWYIIDPIIGIIIVVVIFISTWNLLRDSIRLSLDGVPAGIDIHEIADSMKVADPCILDVHHIHVWALSTTENALTAHVTIKDMKNIETVRCRIRKALALHGINHATLEFELPGNEDGDYCDKCGCR